MAAAAGPLMKLSSMPECCITSLPALFTTKTSHPFLSKPIKHKIPSLSTSFPSWVSVKSKTVSLVARTSDWAQEEEKNPVDGFKWGGDTEGEEVEGDRIADFGDGEGSYAVPSEEAKVFVGNLHYDMDSEKLAQLFDQAGVVEVSEVIYNRETDQSRGFAFVTMSNVEEAEKAVEMFNGYEINGRALSVNKAAPRGSRPERPPRAFEPSFKVYVGNLSWEVDDARLEQVFSEHGKVVEAKVVYNRDTGRSRGFAFVTMASETELNDAIAALDGQTLDGRTLRINIAENRSPRRGSF